MRIDDYGQQILNERDLCNLYLTDPQVKINNALVEEYITFPDFVENIPELHLYTEPNCSVEEFDRNNQNLWFMPDEYKNFDIAKYVLDLCSDDSELQRAGQELILYQQRGLFPLLCYLKYLVDTMRKHNIVWGVGRGSSIASFVLFLIGVHRINSLHYDLSIDEFLK